VRFGYDGAAFQGWARQPGARTVEGEIRRGLAGHRRLRFEPAALEVASRTDRGVHARGNALALTADLPGPLLLRSLNGIAPDLFFWGATEVDPAFRVRSAVRRTYRYFEPAHGGDLARWRAAARRIAGTIDVRSLGRGLGSGGAVWRTVESVSVEPDGDRWIVETRAPSYVWGQVRKTVGALREIALGRLSEERFAEALAGRTRLTLPLAEPERLVLWEVEHGIPPAVRWEGPNRHQVRYWSAERAALRDRARLLDLLDPTGAGAPSA
jgi:tRNA pseudouridine38-40 synthase